jgi:hypothetical protein
MDNKSLAKPFSRSESRRNKAAKKKGFIAEAKMWIAVLQSSAWFLISMGVLLIGTGMICFMAFHNMISQLFLDLGLTIFLVGIFVRVIDVFLKIIGVR